MQTKHQAGRLKQWLHYLRRHYPEAGEAYQRVRTINAPAALEEAYFGPLLARVPSAMPAALAA